MGEGTTGLETTTTDRRDGHQALVPADVKKALEAEIIVLREELGELGAELDRRRHEMLDVRHHVRRHAFEGTVTTLALVGAATGFVWLGGWRARRRNRLMSQAPRLRHAVTRMIDRPERVAAESTVPMKILTAAANAAVATLMKKGLERGRARYGERAPAPSADRRRHRASNPGRDASNSGRGGLIRAIVGGGVSSLGTSRSRRERRAGARGSGPSTRRWQSARG